jgi:hypothetical protein
MMYIDHSVYPDVEALPEQLTTPAEKADYVHRICAAWDFGLVPEWETFDLFRGWRDVFDRYSLPYSPAYHAFRAWFGWPTAEKGKILDTYAEMLDRLEGRGEDPCRRMI